MSQTVGDYLLERLTTWGVKRIYGYPGDGINGIMRRVQPLEQGSQRPEFIQVRHEEMAAFMACAHAKFTGEVGRLPGDLRPRRDPPAQRPLRREARPPAGGRDRRPAGAGRDWAATTSRRSTCSRCSRTSPTSTCRWRRSRRRSATSSIAPCGSRSTERTVTCVIVPNDLQEADAVEQPPREHGTVHSGPGLHARRASCPREDDLERAAEILNAGERVAMLVGAGRAARRRRGRSAVADLLGAGVAKALLGKAVAARRPALRDRLDRPARHEAELGH